MIKLKLSTAYVKHEKEIFDLISKICLDKGTIFDITTSYDKFLLDSDGIKETVFGELLPIDGDENNDNPLENFEDELNFNSETLKLDTTKLNKLFDIVINNNIQLLHKEFNDEVVINEVIENIKSLFAEQIELSLSSTPNFKVDLSLIECNVFMNLGPNKIKLDIPGITKINGTNGIGKTTLLNMLRFIIRGVVFDGLKASNKKLNALLIFNDKLINKDIVKVRLIAYVNNTQIAITRITTRKWKNNATDEMKASLNWKQFISEVTSSITLDVMSKDGQKQFTGDQAENMVKAWFGNVAENILILNAAKIDSILNLPSDKIQNLVLDYIGVDYIKVLKENLLAVKNNYNLVRPKTNLEDLKISVNEKHKLKKDGKENLLLLEEKQTIAKQDVETIETNIENKNNELLKIGDIPAIIEKLVESIELKTKEKNEFVLKEKNQLPTFEIKKPEKENISEKEAKVLSLTDKNKVDKENLSTLETTKNQAKNDLIDVVKNQKDKYPGEISRLFKEKVDKIKIDIDLTNQLIDNRWDNLSNNIFGDTVKKLEEKYTEKNNFILDIRNNKTLLVNRNIKIDEEILSGVCEKCLRPFGDDFENHKLNLEKEKLENKTQIDTYQVLLDKEELVLGNIKKVTDTWKTYYEKSLLRDYKYFKNLENFDTLAFKQAILDVEDIFTQVSELSTCSLNLEKENIQFFIDALASEPVTLTKEFLENYDIFTLIGLVNHNKSLISSDEKIIENLLTENVEYNYNWNDIRLVDVLEKIRNFNASKISIENIDTEIEELNKYINNVNSDYNTAISDYNTKFDDYNKEFQRINNLNNEIDIHNKSINDIKGKLIDLEKEKLEKENLKPTYENLTKVLAELKLSLKTVKDDKETIDKEYNELDKELINIDNDIDKLNDDIEEWIKYKSNKMIYGLYEKLINNDFPDIVFEYYRTHLNKALNILLNDLNFKLFWDKSGDLYMIEFGGGIQTYRPVQLTSGMQTCFLGLSLIYAIHLLNVKNDISHLFIDELSGALNSGKELIEKSDIINFQEQFVNLLNKFTNKSIFIVDHNIENLFQTVTYEVVKDKEQNYAKFITVE